MDKIKINTIHDLLKYDVLYGYCHKTEQYEVLKTISEIKKVDGYKRVYIKGFDERGYKLYTQVNLELYEKLCNKFTILQEYKIN
jgi:hypothetical protein